MRPKAKKKRRAYHSRASRIAALSDPLDRWWLAITGQDPLPHTAEMSIARRAYFDEDHGGLTREEWPKVEQFLRTALAQRNAEAFQRLADAMELVDKRWRAFLALNLDADPDRLAICLTFADLLGKHGKPTTEEWQTYLQGMRVQASEKTVRARVHAMRLPLADPGRPKTRK